MYMVTDEQPIRLRFVQAARRLKSMYASRSQNGNRKSRRKGMDEEADDR